MPDNRGMLGKIIEHYRIDRMVGQGGMAVVYEATDLQLERQVAIKIMHSHLASQSSFQERFLQEARAAASLDHPNIVRVLSFNIAENELFIVMELATGGNLRQYVKRLHEESRFMDYTEAVELTRQLADALDYAHRQNMIHRDIKPDNVVLKPDRSSTNLIPYRPILTDFGLAKLTAATNESAVTDQPLGTYAYMSPEQCLAERVDARTDIYSLGIMLYELTVGQLPYRPKTIAEAARMHGREPLTQPSALRRDFPTNLEEIIIKCLHKHPDKRYQRSSEIVYALTTVLPTLQKSAPIPTASTTSQPRPSTPPSAPPISTAKEDKEFTTDVATQIMDMPLPEAMPDYSSPPIMPEDRGYDRLLFISGNLPVKTARLDQPVMHIGRGYDQDIILDGESVSRSHIRIEHKPNGIYYIVDTDSSNGTWLNTNRLKPNTPVILSPEAVVRLGDYRMKLELKHDIPAEEEILTPVEVPISEDAITPPPQVAETSPEGEVTQIIAALSSTTMPDYTSPPLSIDQTKYGRLLFLSESYPLLVFDLKPDTLRIGRAENQDITLADDRISRRHARIERKNDGSFTITDVGSSNGVWMDNERLEANTPTLLDPEKPIRLGDYWLLYEPRQAIPLPEPPTLTVDKEGRKIEVDPNATVIMVKPLPQAMPDYSPPPLTAQQRVNDRLIFFSDDHPMRIISIDKETLSIGRDPEQDIVLEGKRISRSHLRIDVNPDGKLYITDLNSTNGVWVEDTLLIADTQVLWEPHETIRIANYWMKFERGTRAFTHIQGLNQLDNRGLVGKTIKHYHIDQYLGQGGIAAVYTATDTRLNVPVALKILHPNFVSEPALKQRFIQEARVLSRLDHPNIVNVMSFDDVDNELFLVMELITGGSLRAYIKRLADEGRAMDFAEAIDMGIQMADALHYAHQQGLMHRDIKPENVVLKPGEGIGPLTHYQPVLTDFGLAQLAETGEIFITDKPDVAFPYMSPEQCLSERIDVRSDLYELGVVLYELTTGKPPFQPRSMAEAVRMHAREKLQPPAELRPGYPDSLQKVITRSLEKDPNDRYQTAAEMSRALQRAAIAGRIDLDTMGSISSIHLSGPVDDPITVIMDQPLPRQMPSHTRQPVSDEALEYDQLVIYNENEPTLSVSLNKDILTVGRDNDQDITLSSKTVSRRHARIERGVGNSYRIIDMGSANGTYLGEWRLIANVAEIWGADATVRIGDYWFRIQTAESLKFEKEHPPLLGQAPVPDEEARPARKPTIQHPPPDHDKIGVTVENRYVRVVPGESATMPIEILNRSDLVDHFKVELLGLPPDWITQPVDPLYLLPHNRDTTSVTFHPPMNSRSTSGQHAFEVRVTARAQGIHSVTNQGSLTITPFFNYTADLQPKRIKNKGIAELVISNTGNTFGTYMIDARDREGAVRFNIPGQQYTLPPGQKERIPLRVSPQKRPFLGSVQTLPFEVNLTPSNEGGAPQLQAGELVVRPIFPFWLIGAFVLLCTLCFIVSLLGYTQYTTMQAQNQTAVAIALATNANATVTALAEEDTDGDSLSNAREAELGTDPNLADTDEDGLSDGEEVRVWLTNPLNRDTDGDKLIDGTEVNVLGTDPLERDTDGDGIPDNEDISPMLQSTATPTPFPTIGPDGDICPGSPLPSRLEVGMKKAAVTAGGVANRVRDAPGKNIGAIIGYMPPGTTFDVLDGPECDPDDQLRWWNVTSASGLSGWTAEGEGDEYYLEPPGGSGDGGGSANDKQTAAGLDGSQMGVQIDGHIDLGTWDTIMGWTDPLDIGWVKFQASWRVLEPDYSGQFDTYFQYLQAHIQDAQSRGYKVLLSVAKAPDWARNIDRTADGPPDDPQALAEFLKILLSRVGTNINAIEIWNEPNVRREWVGGLPFSGAGYMQLFGPAYSQIREFSSDIIIVTAGLAPTGSTDNSVDDREYLRQMYDAGLANYTDVMIGVHPYGWANSPDARCCADDSDQGWDNAPQFFFMDTIDAYHQIMEEYGDTDAQLWITEFGWATWEGFASAPPDPWMASITADNQASNILRAFQIGQGLDYTGPMLLWNLNLATPTLIENSNEMAAYSLLYPDSANNNELTARPLYDLLVNRGES